MSINSLKQIAKMNKLIESKENTYLTQVLACDNGLYFLYLILHSICALHRSHTSHTFSAFIFFICGVLSCKSFLKANEFLCFCARFRVWPEPRCELIILNKLYHNPTQNLVFQFTEQMLSLSKHMYFDNEISCWCATCWSWNEWLWRLLKSSLAVQSERLEWP